MAQTGFTPIQIYYSTTSSNLPLAANLTNGELAINSADGKLFYKDSGGTVQTLASQNLFASQTANYVYASPNGSAGVPTFRALVAADIPALSGSYVPYTGASSAVDLNAKTLVNVANLGVNTTTVPNIRVRAIGDNGSFSRITMRGYSSDANSSAIRVSKFRGTAAAPQTPISGDSLGKFELAGYGSTAAEAYPQVSVEGVTTEIWSATARGAKAVIKVTPNTTITQVTAVTVDQDSKVTMAGALSVTGHTTFEGVTSTGATGTGKLVYNTTPTLVTPALGTPSALVGTNITGTATAFTASNVTTNANLTGPITSVGNATSIASQTGTGKFVFDTSPTITGATLTTAALNGTLGATTPSTGKFTTLESSGAVTVSSGGTLFVGSTTGFNFRKLYLLYDDSVNNGFAINESTGAASAQFQLFSSNGTTCGSIVRVGSTSAVTYSTVSDYRLKTVTAPVSDAGKRIDSLNPIEYDWNNGDGHARGFLAHEFAKVYSNSVSGEKDAVDKDGNPSYQSMQASTSEVMADLIAEIQSLRKRVAQLELK